MGLRVDRLQLDALHIGLLLWSSGPSVLLPWASRLARACLKADLIDAISLALYPGIDGLAGIPSIFE